MQKEFNGIGKCLLKCLRNKQNEAKQEVRHVELLMICCMIMRLPYALRINRVCFLVLGICISKALSAIKAAKMLTSKENPVYPVFWMGSEDHDFEEINHIHWEGKTLQWDQEQGNAVGRMSTQGLDQAIDEVMSVATSSLPREELVKLQGQLDAWKTKKNTTYATLWQMALYQLFQDEELIVINADDHRLKKLFTPIMLNELRTDSLQTCVKESDEGVFAAYSMPLHLRETNLFHFENGVRQRVELDKNDVKSSRDMVQ